MPSGKLLSALFSFLSLLPLPVLTQSCTLECEGSDEPIPPIGNVKCWCDCGVGSRRPYTPGCYSTAASTAAPPVATSSDPTPQCSSNSAPPFNQPTSFEINGQSQDRNQLLYLLRDFICGGNTAGLSGIPTVDYIVTGSATSDEEIAVALAGYSEAYLYRGTPSTGDQWQECYDSTQNIIEQCVKNGPNTGWVNGPNEYQFYQGGFRPVNGAGAKHTPFGAGVFLGATAASNNVASSNANNAASSNGNNAASNNAPPSSSTLSSSTPPPPLTTPLSSTSPVSSSQALSSTQPVSSPQLVSTTASTSSVQPRSSTQPSTSSQHVSSPVIGSSTSATSVSPSSSWTSSAGYSSLSTVSTFGAQSRSGTPASITSAPVYSSSSSPGQASSSEAMGSSNPESAPVVSSGSSGVPTITAIPSSIPASATSDYASAALVVASMTQAAASFSASMSAWDVNQGDGSLASAAQTAFENLVDLVHQAQNAVEILINKGIDDVNIQAVVTALVTFIASVPTAAWVWGTVGLLIWKSLSSVLSWISSIWNWFGSPTSSGGSGSTPTLTGASVSLATSAATCSGSACALCTLPTATPLPDLPSEDVLSQTDTDFPLFLNATGTSKRNVGKRESSRTSYYNTDPIEQELAMQNPHARFLKRSTDPQTITCQAAPAAPDLNYILPDYPSTPSAAAANPNGGAAAIASISKWWDMEEYRTAQGPCSFRFDQFPGRVDGNEYATEHIFEKHFLKSFLIWASAFHDLDGSPTVAGTCTNFYAAFGTVLQTGGQTAAQAMANCISCQGTGCPDNSRVSEFYILEANINKMKTIVLSYTNANAGEGLPDYSSTSATWSTIGMKMYQVAMVFQYLNQPGVSAQFITTNNRFRTVLQQLDADPAGQNHRPTLPVPNLNNAPGTWTQAWDYWLSGFLHYKQEKMESWMHNALIAIRAAQANDPGYANNAGLTAQIDMEADTGGLFTADAVAFGAAYAAIMSINWST